MSTKVDRSENLFAYFQVRVDEAIHTRRTPVSADASLYLAQLLTDRARTDRPAPQAHTLAELHKQGVEARRPADRARVYRELGDRALYDLGYFAEQLDRRAVGPTYYEAMGSAAYERVDDVLKRFFADAFGELFRELAQGFHSCAAILRSIREAHDARDSLSEMYANWQRTGSEELARKLRLRGLVIPAGQTET